MACLCWKEREGSQRNIYAGPMDKDDGGRIESGRWEWVGWGGVRESGSRKMETTVPEQQ